MKFKNKLILTLVNLLKKSSTFPNGDHPRKILVVSTTALGDSLWGTPAIRALKNALPDSEIHLLTSEIGREVFLNNRHITGIHLFPKNFGFAYLSLARRLKKMQFDTAVSFHTSQRMALPLVKLIGVGEIHGSKSIQKGLDKLLTHPREWKYEHEIDRRLALCNQVTPIKISDKMELFLLPDEIEVAHNFCKKNGLKKGGYFVLHSGAANRFKMWPKERFIALGKILQIQFPNTQIVITGTPSEKALVTTISERIEGSIICCGDLSLRPFAAFLENAVCVISNDTGPMHLAKAMATPVVGLFCATDPKLCGPKIDTRSTFVSKPKTCSPCIKKKCFSPLCLGQISPSEVADAICHITRN